MIIKAHYYGSHETINPTRIIPIGPASTLPVNMVASSLRNAFN